MDNQSGFLSSLRNWKIYQGSNNKSGFVIYQISKTLYKTDYKSKRDARGLSDWRNLAGSSFSSDSSVSAKRL